MTSEKRGPNILLIQCDQLTASALSFYGGRTASSPHLDALAREGTVFENAYCNFPICVPSRASMLSGRYASRIGVWDNGAEFSASVPTLAHHLAALGYRTILCGKMHFVGPDQLHGFSERLTTDIYPADFSWTPDWNKPGPPEAGSRISMRGVVEAGICQRTMQIDFDEEVHHRALQRLYDVARSPEDGPFFLTVSYTHPHNPFTVTRAYWDRYDGVEIEGPAVGPIPLGLRDPHSRRLHYVTHADEHDVSDEQMRTARRAYYGMISYIDDKVGELRAVLAETGLADDTIVVVTSDHGEMLGERGMWYKMCLFEPSIRIPLIIRLPGGNPISRIPNNASLVDLLPTLVDLAGGGQARDFGPALDGRSLAPLLRGDAIAGPDRVIAEYTADGAIAPCFMVREGDHKLIWSAVDGALLYDLALDPHETIDRSGDPAFAQIRERLLSVILDLFDPEAMRRRILASQEERLFLMAVAAKAGFPQWDFAPPSLADRTFVRSGMSPAIVKARSRFPRVDAHPLDHPRPEH